MHSFCWHIAEESNPALRARAEMRFSVSITTKAKTTTKTV